MALATPKNRECSSRQVCPNEHIDWEGRSFSATLSSFGMPATYDDTIHFDQKTRYCLFNRFQWDFYLWKRVELRFSHPTSSSDSETVDYGRNSKYCEIYSGFDTFFGSNFDQKCCLRTTHCDVGKNNISMNPSECSVQCPHYDKEFSTPSNYDPGTMRIMYTKCLDNDGKKFYSKYTTHDAIYYWRYFTQCDFASYSIPLDSVLLDDTTYIGKSIRGKIDDPSFAKSTYHSFHYAVKTLCCNQWRSRDTRPRDGDALCHYSIPPVSDNELQNSSPAFAFQKWASDVESMLYTWEKDEEDHSLFWPQPFCDSILFHGYLYMYAQYFYRVLFTANIPSNTRSNMDIVDPTRLVQDILQSKVPFNPYYYKDSVAAQTLERQCTAFLRYPQCRISDTSKTGYAVVVHLDISLFRSMMNNSSLKSKNAQMKAYLDTFFQIASLNITIENQSSPIPNKAVYSLRSCAVLATTFFLRKDADPFALNRYPFLEYDKMITTWKWDDQMTSYLSDQYEMLSEISELNLVYEVLVDIDQWDPVLYAYCAQTLGIKKPECSAFKSMFGLYPVNCNTCTTYSTQSCKDYLSSACNTYFRISNSSIKTLLKDTFLSNNSSSQCKCYASRLPPPSQHSFGDPVSMCFNKYCATTDLEAVKATDAFCKDNCATVSGWLRSKDPGSQSQNPSELNEDRYTALCPFQSPSLHRGVLINGLFITLLLALRVLFVQFRTSPSIRRFLATSLVLLLGTGASVYLAYDLDLESRCPGTVGFSSSSSSPFICQTRLSHIQVPRYFCTYRFCDCFFNEDCESGCQCSSGQCVPWEESGISSSATEEIIPVINIPLLCSCIVTIYMVCWSYHRFFSSSKTSTRTRIHLPIILFFTMLVLLMIVAYFFLLRMETIHSPQSSCKVSLPCWKGTYSMTDPVIDPLSSALSPPPAVPLNIMPFLALPFSSSSIYPPSVFAIHTCMTDRSKIESIPFQLTSFPAATLLDDDTTTTNNHDYLLFFRPGKMTLSFTDSSLIQTGSSPVSFSESSSSIHFPDAFSEPPVVFLVLERTIIEEEGEDEDGDAVLTTVQLAQCTNTFFEYKILQNRGAQWEEVSKKKNMRNHDASSSYYYYYPPYHHHDNDNMNSSDSPSSFSATVAFSVGWIAIGKRVVRTDSESTTTEGEGEEGGIQGEVLYATTDLSSHHAFQRIYTDPPIVIPMINKDESDTTTSPPSSSWQFIPTISNKSTSGCSCDIWCRNEREGGESDASWHLCTAYDDISASLSLSFLVLPVTR